MLKSLSLNAFCWIDDVLNAIAGQVAGVFQVRFAQTRSVNHGVNNRLLPVDFVPSYAIAAAAVAKL